MKCIIATIMKTIAEKSNSMTLFLKQFVKQTDIYMNMIINKDQSTRIMPRNFINII